MAIKPENVRLMATISREQDDLLSELGEFQGRSKGSYLRELLDGAEPMLRALLPVLRLHAATIEGQPVAMRDLVARVMTGAFGDDGPDLLSHLEGIAERSEADHSERSERGPHRTASAQRKSRR